MITPDLLARVRGRVAGGADITSAVRAEVGMIPDDAALTSLSTTLTAELAGAGPLEPILALPGVTDVLVNSPTQVWMDRGAGLEPASVRFPDDGAVRLLAQRLAITAGRRLDDASPYVDVGLPDGTRLHAVLPPLTTSTTLSLRVLARGPFALSELVPPVVGDLLQAVMHARLAVLISGGTGSGKTTLLGALLAEVPPEQRIVTIEDARELVVRHPHVVALAARSPNVEGAGEVTLRELVRQSLRMRPDRIVVGEFRGAETAELLIALNTGHEGGAATVHANAAADVPARLVALGALAGLSRAATHEMISTGVDAVVHVRRGRRGRRAVSEVGVVVPGSTFEPGPQVQLAWTPAGPAPGAPMLAERLVRRGLAVPSALERSPEAAR